jgi:hypothetical protein
MPNQIGFMRGRNILMILSWLMKPWNGKRLKNKNWHYIFSTSKNLLKFLFLPPKPWARLPSF